MLSGSRIQNQGAADNLSSSALKRKAEVDRPKVASKNTPEEESNERRTKRPKTAPVGGIGSADAAEMETLTLPAQPEIGPQEVIILAALENELLRRGTPKIFGRFDLFDMNNSGHSTLYRSNTATSSDSTPHHESVFRTIRTCSDNKLGTIIIPQWYIKTQGSLHAPRLLCNIDGPLDISVVNLLIVPSVELNDIKAGLPPSRNNDSNSTFGPSVQGYLTLDALKLVGVKTALGTFKMRPVWKEEAKGGKTRELFEGSLSFKLVYGDVLKRLGYQDLVQPELGFWAIRAEV